MEALTCLTTRRSILDVTGPGPSEDELRAILRAATTAPDHGRLEPWRLLVIRGEARRALGDVFAQSSLLEDPELESEKVERLREKPMRAPLIIGSVWSRKEHPKIPEWEQLASAVCATYGISLAAHALGYGAVWRTGPLCDHGFARKALDIAEHERIIGWIYIGRPKGGRSGRERSTAGRVSEWGNGDSPRACTA
ncbi:nitroreductase family protein [Streptomyces sp. NRRL B-1347]|uniref:nitroreductase family protein n=1 Tax=Streptomyces sp. NRRL B-1347 TaxID=1476877 RepID=UPI00068F8E9D|nr:nitroreductase [Streptomyces sp. NRRL B-1347]